MTSLLTRTHLLWSSFQLPARSICGHVINMEPPMPTDVTMSENMIILVLSTKSNLYLVIIAPPMKPPKIPDNPGKAEENIRRFVIGQKLGQNNFNELPAPRFALNAGMWKWISK